MKELKLNLKRTPWSYFVTITRRGKYAFDAAIKAVKRFFGRVIAKMAFWIIEKHKEGGHHIHLLIQTDSNSKELDRAARGVSNNGTPHIQKYSDTDHQFNYVLSKMNVGLNEHGYVIDGIVC